MYENYFKIFGNWVDFVVRNFFFWYFFNLDFRFCVDRVRKIKFYYLYWIGIRGRERRVSKFVIWEEFIFLCFKEMFNLELLELFKNFEVDNLCDYLYKIM